MAYPYCGDRPRDIFPPLCAVTPLFMGFKMVEALGVGYFFDLLIRVQTSLPTPQSSTYLSSRLYFEMKEKTTVGRSSQAICLKRNTVMDDSIGGS